MSRGGASLFNAGRIAEVAIWCGALPTQGNVDELYNSGSGKAANTVPFGLPVAYWKLCGTASPEPAAVGSVAMTVTGATSATHPINTCAAAAPVRHRVISQ